MQMPEKIAAIDNQPDFGLGILRKSKTACIGHALRNPREVYAAFRRLFEAYQFGDPKIRLSDSGVFGGDIRLPAIAERNWNYSRLVRQNPKADDGENIRKQPNVFHSLLYAGGRWFLAERQR